MNYLEAYLSDCSVRLEEARLTKCNKYWHETGVVSVHNCIYYILDGEGVITLNDISYYPVKGDIVVIPKGAHVDYGPINENYYYKYWCHFQVGVGNVGLFDIINVPFVFHIGESAAVKRLFESIISPVTSPIERLSKNADLMKLLSLILKLIGDETIVTKNDRTVELIERLDTYIAENISHQITLDELSELLHYHPNYIIKLFHRYHNMTPAKYIERIRIEQVKKLLSETDAPINEIAFLVGYSSGYHLSNRFKRAVGMSPTLYRHSGTNK